MQEGTSMFTPLPPNVMPNVVQNRDDFYISYNPVDVAIYGDVTTAIPIESVAAVQLVIPEDERTKD